MVAWQGKRGPQLAFKEAERQVKELDGVFEICQAIVRRQIRCNGG